MEVKSENLTAIGENIMAAKVEDKIVLVIDPSQRLGRSASGKTVIVASTRGNIQFNGVTFGVNAYVKEK